MKKKTLAFILTTAFAVSCYSAFYTYSVKKERAEMAVLELSNVEALSGEEEDYGSVCFSNLRYVECNITVYKKGKDESYIVKGNKRSCVKEWTTNACKIAWETPCKRITQ